ncbi:MAG: DNA polymerase III subunit beta [bacterium]
MILETTVEKLIPLVDSANRITARNSTLSALGTILITVSKNILKIRATNLSLGIELEMSVKSEKDGVVAIDGKILAEFLNTLQKNSKIKIVAEETTISVITDKNRTTIKTHPYEDFPTLPTVSGVEVSIPKNEFIRGVKMTAFSAALSDIKPEISSVCVVADKNTLIFAATDSFRLAEKREVLHKPAEFSPIIIPYKNINEIARVIEGVSGDVKVTIGENQISFTSPSVYITSRIISGSFPDYKQIIPKSFTTDVIVLKQDILNVLKSANIFSDKFNQITFVISPSKKKMECLSKNNDVGEFIGAVDASLTGDDVSISINQRYFMDCLAFIPQDSISIGLNGGSRPVVIRGVSDGSFTYLLMPMNR